MSLVSTNSELRRVRFDITFPSDGKMLSQIRVRIAGSYGSSVVYKVGAALCFI